MNRAVSSASETFLLFTGICLATEELAHLFTEECLNLWWGEGAASYHRCHGILVFDVFRIHQLLKEQLWREDTLVSDDELALDLSTHRAFSLRIASTGMPSLLRYHYIPGPTPSQAENVRKNAARALVAKRQGLMLDVDTAYYALVAARERLAIRRKAEEEAGENLRIVRLKFDSGSAGKLEVLAAEIQLARASSHE